MILRQQVAEFREQRSVVIMLVQRLLHCSQVLDCVKGCFTCPSGTLDTVEHLATFRLPLNQPGQQCYDCRVVD